MSEENKGIFLIQARKCKRCGRLLTSKEAVARGYGCQCAAKAKLEEMEKQPVPGQYTMMDWIKQYQEGEKE